MNFNLVTTVTVGSFNDTNPNFLHSVRTLKFAIHLHCLIPPKKINKCNLNDPLRYFSVSTQQPSEFPHALLLHIVLSPTSHRTGGVLLGPAFQQKNDCHLWASHRQTVSISPEPRKKKPALLSRKYWLVNRDPYNGLLQSLYNWVVFHPLYTLNNRVCFIAHLHTAPVFIQ